MADVTARSSPASKAGGRRGPHFTPQPGQPPGGDVNADGASSLAAPRSLAVTGLPPARLAELLSRVLYLYGSASPGELSEILRVRREVTAELVRYAQSLRWIEPARPLSEASEWRLQLTPIGRMRTREVLKTCRYIGPAPVSMRDYFSRCREQAFKGAGCSRESLMSALADLQNAGQLVDLVGPALYRGGAILIQSPTGQGKSALARRLARWINQSGGEVYVPYAVQLDRDILTVFDPMLHQTVVAPDPGCEGNDDRRGVRVRRPVVSLSGKSSLLESGDSGKGTFRGDTVPLPIKANGGVLIVDDFDRQCHNGAAAQWLVPLHDRLYPFAVGPRLRVSLPFEALPLLCFGGKEGDLDPSLLRRIPNRIRLPVPTAEDLTALLERMAAETGVIIDRRAAHEIFASQPNPPRPSRWSDPQDLLEMSLAIVRFGEREASLGAEILKEAAQRCFGHWPGQQD